MAYQPQVLQDAFSRVYTDADLVEQVGETYHWAPLSETELTVIVPTKNEADNVEPLLQRLSLVLEGTPTEVIFVDDSSDDTTQVIKAAARRFPFNMTVCSRAPQRRNGLGKAVVEGIKLAHSDWIVVMDGDLQHPPEVIPQLMEQARTSDSDLVVTSRLAEGGGTVGLSPGRRLISQSLALTTRTVFPKRLRQVTDPLTGFFLVKRKSIDPENLQPEGFKILLEILIRSPRLSISEVPFEFGERNSGESKADVREVAVYMRQMLRLVLISQQRMIRFLTVGLSGLVVNTLLMVFFTELFSIHYLVSAVFATQGSTLWNFSWTEKWVFSDRNAPANAMWMRLLVFLLMSNALLLLRTPFLAFLVSQLGVHYAVANVITLVLMFLVRFAVSDRVLWQQGEDGSTPEQRTQDLRTKDVKRYTYNVHDMVHIRSMKDLPELAYFRTEEPLDRIDVDVLIASNPAKYKREDSIVYEEFPGRYGFSLVINRDEELTEIIASQLVGWSPHVLYTNAVEPILRWFLVRRGYALMHGASIAFGDDALFITAETDTGKTTTVLHTVRNNCETGRFLADDMTIVSPDGTLSNYPKPLTISNHTLQAIGGAPLTRMEWSKLLIQSRIHSRSGRHVAKWIDSNSFPAATINAIAQIVIPPPKYMIERIIPEAKYGQSAKLRQIVVIERGEDFTSKMSEADKLKTLIANAEDAYGFPPYPVIAHQLTRWGDQDLQQVEQKIVMSAVENIPATRMGSSCYDWYARLPNLITSQPTEVDIQTNTVPEHKVEERLEAGSMMAGVPGD